MSDIEYELKSRFCVDFKQSDAFERLSKHPTWRLFSFEAPKFKPGCRKFVTAELRDFYLFYRECKFERHFYEIIPEGKPCRLYFDLEYYKTHNPAVDATAMVDSFLDVCTNVIADTLGLQLNRERSFLILDSSTSSKFSAHVIVHLPDDRLFPSNVAMKPLVKLICQRLLERNVGLVVGEKGEDDVKFICDLAVYTKNRNFRLFLSSKCGKEAALKYADYSSFYDEQPLNAQIFLDSLVVPKDFDQHEVITMPEIKLVSPSSSTNPNATKSLKSVENIIGPEPTKNGDVYVLRSGRVPSPFPELDDYMLTDVFRALKSDAQIRLWRLLYIKSSQSRLMQYQLTNCRFCYNKQREHRSQNVYWSVNLNDFDYVQRCFDITDCYQFCSQKFEIPQRIVEQISSRINRVYERLLSELAYSASFYTSHYDRLFQELLLPTQFQEPYEENNDENDIICIN